MQLANESKQIALAAETADELSKSQAYKHGAGYAEKVAKNA